MSFLNSFHERLVEKTAERVMDKPRDIENWMDEMGRGGATRADLKRRDEGGYYKVRGMAFDAKGELLGKVFWRIGGANPMELFRGENEKHEITYNITFDEDFDE
ncbi:MAG: hypothetical protein LBK56_04660 [Gracilibacteraceae bacterium]|jgi:hypothetical protein|nr:hypothetical protein [Gracilibacteraceae bacterium]